MDFQVVVDASILELHIGADIEPNHNKWLLSLINDFEDGKWRYEIFENFIWDNIADTALTHKERVALVGSPRSMLTAAAKNLRLTDAENDISKGSELAEIVLYGIMRHKFGALPVVPKIFYKQNVQDNAKGADSVHIVVSKEGGFTLWFGEAKFYNSIEDARLNSIVESIKSSLATDKLRKENSIIVSVPEIDEIALPDSLKEEIKDALSPKESIDRLKPKINVPILLLHECDITAGVSEATPAYIERLIDHHKVRANSYFAKQAKHLVEIHKYSEITFHLILFPVPSKEAIIDKFVETVAHYKG